MSIPSPSHEILSGGVAGMVSIFFGQPFDTLKVRLQTSSSSHINIKSLLSTMRLSDYFRGLTPPLLTAVGVNATVFTVYGTTCRAIDDYRRTYDPYNTQTTTTTTTTADGDIN